MPRTERCETCKWWDDEPDNERDGKCRRHTPTIEPYILEQDQFEYPWGTWPMTYADDWCGEWQPAPMTTEYCNEQAAFHKWLEENE